MLYELAPRASEKVLFCGSLHCARRIFLLSVVLLPWSVIDAPQTAQQTSIVLEQDSEKLLLCGVCHDAPRTSLLSVGEVLTLSCKEQTQKQGIQNKIESISTMVCVCFCLSLCGSIRAQSPPVTLPQHTHPALPFPLRPPTTNPAAARVERSQIELIRVVRLSN
jgi:hypothetical protein